MRQILQKYALSRDVEESFEKFLIPHPEVDYFQNVISYFVCSGKCFTMIRSVVST